MTDNTTICPRCGHDLTQPESIRYLSGDSLMCHFEAAEDGTLELVKSPESEGDCESRVVCDYCDCEVESDYSNNIWS